MKYETQPDGHLRITIQPGHTLWNLFRECYRAAVNFNLHNRGENPVTNALTELFPDVIGTNREEYLRVGLLESPKQFPSGVHPYDYNLKVWKTRADVYSVCRIIEKYLLKGFEIAGQKLLDKEKVLSDADWARLGEMQTAVYQIPPFTDSYEEDRRHLEEKAEAFQEGIKKRSNKVFDTLDQQRGIARHFEQDCVILFEGSDGTQSYIHKTGDKPSPHDTILFDPGSGPIVIDL